MHPVLMSGNAIEQYFEISDREDELINFMSEALSSTNLEFKKTQKNTQRILKSFE